MDDEIVRAANAKKGSPFLNTDQAATMSACRAGPSKRCVRPVAAHDSASMAATSGTTSTTSTNGPRRLDLGARPSASRSS